MWQKQSDNGDLDEPQSVYVRNYETSKDRCDRIEKFNQAGLLEKVKYDSKRLNFGKGENLRTKVRSMEKHLPLKLSEVREHDRV